MPQNASREPLLDKQSQSLAPYLSVLGGFIVLFSIGSLQYTFGNLLPYIASYLASNDQDTQGNYEYYIDNGTWVCPLCIFIRV